MRAEEALAEVARTGRGRRIRRLALMLVVPLLVLLAGGWWWMFGGRWASTDNAYVHQDIVQLSADVAGRITEVAVRENQHVTAGETLFRLDDRPYRIALQQDEAASAPKIPPTAIRRCRPTSPRSDAEASAARGAMLAVPDRDAAMSTLFSLSKS